MKIAYYRAYTDRYSSGVYGASDWQNNPSNLVSFMGTFEASGGNYHESVELGLYKAE